MPTLDTDDGDTETYSDEEERLGFKLDCIRINSCSKKENDRRHIGSFNEISD